MYFCNLLQFNFNQMFAVGNCLGNMFRNSLFGNTSFENNLMFTNPFMGEYQTFMPLQNNVSIFGFNGDMNYMPLQTNIFSNSNLYLNSTTYNSTFTTPANYQMTATPTFSSPSQSVSKPSKEVKTHGSAKTNLNDAEISNKGIKNLQWWKDLGYNEENGLALARNVKKRSDELHAAGVKSQCAMGVRGGINDTYYNGSDVKLKTYYDNGKLKAKYEGTQHYKGFGKAKDVGDNFLSKDMHFKKIDISGMELSADDIPAGVTVIYEDYSGNKCGHIEVSGGNGHGYSDFTSTSLFRNNGKDRKPKEIWIPV